MANLVDIIVPALWVGGICSVFYTAIDSPLRPLQSWVLSWRNAFAYPTKHYFVALFILTIFLVSPTLDFVFGKYLRVPGWILLSAAWSWQALAAGLLGFIAVRVHYEALEDDPVVKRKPYAANRRREWWAFAIGVGGSLALLGANFGLAFLASPLPKAWQPLGFTFNGLVRHALLFVPFAIIRPVLSLGANRPVRSAFVGFSRRPVSFLIWISAVGSIPPWFANYAMESFVRPGAFALGPFWISHALLAVFNLLNFLAFEMTTFRMVRNLSWAPKENFEVGRDESL